MIHTFSHSFHAQPTNPPSSLRWCFVFWYRTTNHCVGVSFLGATSGARTVPLPAPLFAALGLSPRLASGRRLPGDFARGHLRRSPGRGRGSGPGASHGCGLGPRPRRLGKTTAWRKHHTSMPNSRLKTKIHTSSNEIPGRQWRYNDCAGALSRLGALCGVLRGPAQPPHARPQRLPFAPSALLHPRGLSKYTRGRA